ncbi:Sterol 3-beta-glucosyltransferase UGT80B1 [Exophiala dermatitidis]
MATALSRVATDPLDSRPDVAVEPLSISISIPQAAAVDQERVESDSTSCDDTKNASSTQSSTPEVIPIQNGIVERPTLAAHKFDTEIARPVAQRLPAARRHQSTLDTPAYREGFTSHNDSEGWDSSDDEEYANLRKSYTQPEEIPLSKSDLNRARVRPKQQHLRVGNDYFQARGGLARDGRLNISVNETANTGYLAKALGATIERHLGTEAHHVQEERDAAKAKADFLQAKPHLQIPRMNIVIMVIGSRGDIQPFLKIGKILQDKYHHRVRIATHPTFKKFVQEEIGLEFFSVGGDPSELMAFMVKNPGLVPTLETLKAGEVGRRRESMYQMFQGFWRACINATDDETDAANLKMMGSKPPFVADAIIANPPSFAHYHCAERLSIPLHLVFTFPYSPTQAFPHPLANIKATNVDQSYSNFISYPLVDLMTWQGLGDLVNRFRVYTLGLEPVSTLWAPGQLSRLKVPMTYLWSPGLVPKPRDWGPEIDIAGYVFLDLATSYKPPEDLVQFLDRSKDDRPIVYIGFGSISGIDDPLAFTKMIFEGVAKANVRAVISRGWGGMGDGMEKPDGVFMIDNVPHDWLFPKVDAVVHHGGAGTTAAGLRFGKPTMIVPFFGDQPFWSAMVAKAGAGAKQALPWKKLNSDLFAEGIRQCLEPDAKSKAMEIAKSIEKEGDGAENAVDSFHRSLDLNKMRCRILHDRAAAWKIKEHNIQLSALAADLLVENKELHWSDLELYRTREWNDFQGPGEPITGAGGVLVQAFQEAFHGLATIHETTKKDIEHYEKHRRKQRKSIKHTLVLPGNIALAARGTSVKMQQQEQARLQREMNLQGEAEPVRLPFSPSNGQNDRLGGNNPQQLTRTATDLSQHPPAVVVILRDIGRGIGHSTRAIAVLPLQLWNALALGFHNAPRLYGDKTVRPSPGRIPGFRAGVKVAGKEFWLGLYDGFTGVVRIPYLEVHDEGIIGLPKGVAKGLGGLVLKPISGVLGLGAYPARGFHNSIRRRVRDTEKTDRWIRRARIAQGQREAEEIKESPPQPQAPLSATSPLSPSSPLDPSPMAAGTRRNTDGVSTTTATSRSTVRSPKQQKRPMYLRPNPRAFEDLRDRVLRAWAMYEKQLAAEEKKEKNDFHRRLLLLKGQRSWRERAKKSAAGHR